MLPAPDVQSSADRLRLVGLALPVLALLALVGIRIVRQPALDFDERIFLDVGRQIVDTGLPYRTYAFESPRLFFDHTPLYVYAVALLTALGGPTALIARAISLVFAVLTVMLVYRIGARVHGPVSGLVGALLLGANPFFATYAWFVRMEMPLCFCLVLAVWLLLSGRMLLAGLAIAVAVMLKEIALAFWVVAVVYALVRHGPRAATLVAIPAPVALLAWLAYAATIDGHQLTAVLGRWGRSVGGAEPGNRRFAIGPRAWLATLAGSVTGPVLVFAAGAAAGVAAMRRARIPAIALVPLGYAVLAVAASFLISLKEPRFVIAVVPMAALAIALIVDWDAAWQHVRGRAPDASSDRNPVPG